jgi:uncharacterized membrane protein YfcA
MMLRVLSATAVLAIAVGIGAALYVTAIRQDWEAFALAATTGAAGFVFGSGCVNIADAVRQVRRRHHIDEARDLARWEHWGRQ